MTAIEGKDRRAAKTAQTLIGDNYGEWYTSGAFEELFGAAMFLSRTGSISGFPLANLSAILELRQSCVTIIDKLDWLFHRRLSGELEVERWFYFGASDIVAFHILLRSLLDSVAVAISRIAPSQKVTPESFADLRSQLRPGSKNEARARRQLGEELSEAISSCYWFEEMRDVRDDIVHREAQTILYLDDERILFQLHRRLQGRLHVPAVMFNENVADWALYSALAMSRLLAFLNVFSEAVFVVTPALREERGLGTPQSTHPGFRVLHDGIAQLLGSAESDL